MADSDWAPGCDSDASASLTNDSPASMTAGRRVRTRGVGDEAQAQALRELKESAAWTTLVGKAGLLLSPAQAQGIITTLQREPQRNGHQWERGGRAYNLVAGPDGAPVLQAISYKDFGSGAAVWRRQVTTADVMDVIWSVHDARGHLGIDSTYGALQQTYYGPTREMVRSVVGVCKSCKLSAPQKKPKNKQVIITRTLWGRVQIDLIDMSDHQTSAGNKYILNIRDHFSGYIILVALPNKEATSVARHLLRFFLWFDTPLILHSDNGSEFVNAVITAMKTVWPRLKTITGRPYHPQSQGGVESSNKAVKKQLTTEITKRPGVEWDDLLDMVAHDLNRRTLKHTKRTPFEVVFGQQHGHNVWLQAGHSADAQVILDERDEAHRAMIEALGAPPLAAAGGAAAGLDDQAPAAGGGAARAGDQAPPAGGSGGVRAEEHQAARTARGSGGLANAAPVAARTRRRRAADAEEDAAAALASLAGDSHGRVSCRLEGSRIVLSCVLDPSNTQTCLQLPACFAAHGGRIVETRVRTQP
ncbi:hypothetical protein Rsub_07437 [Raphidocelis subcapitata]|uniref:Integrase catalytic domain-containing protein n=1 Tax=Raphidocelis subcapitata TaxID=307507 RepID=A0A2V0P497_9CHLO|nr:hypothetical protein Rsub_07437 [Raphidocelis subcapitata]|eukprot:GBF94701.1 hypothetical protein Rsub_07437 [Raphidocelis subcapitata]